MSVVKKFLCELSHWFNVLMCTQFLRTHFLTYLYLLATSFDEILEEDERLVDVPPVLPAIVDPLPDHLDQLGRS